MAKTIQDLPELTAVNVSTDDLITIQDVSVPKTKKINVNEFKELMNTEQDAKFDKLSALKVLNVTFNNGTGTRSRYNSNPTVVAIPGATGDTSYTAPCDVDILFTCSMMLNPGTSTLNHYLGINGAIASVMSYYQGGSVWSVQTVTAKVSVNAGATITIGALWFASANNQAEVCNNTADGAFACKVNGIVIPRTL